MSLPAEALLLAVLVLVPLALLVPELVAALRAVRAPAPTAGPDAKVIPFRPRQEADRAS
jgi:hypothetical protein